MIHVHRTRPFRAVLAAVAGLAALAAAALAQPTSRSPLDPPPNGMTQQDPTWHLITNATVHIAPGVTIDNATVEIRHGKIGFVGNDTPDSAARVHDGTGLHLYAAFIEPFMEVDAAQPAEDTPGVHWNERVTPQRHALVGPGLGNSDREALRKLGFAAAHLAPESGVFRGRSAVVSLADPPSDESAGDPPVYRSSVGQVVSFETGRWPSPGYPGSHMGAIALIRQTLIDADHRAANRDAPDADAVSCLDELADAGELLIFDVDHELKALQASEIGREFGRPVAVVGIGSEYQRLDALASDDAPIIVPLRFPAAPDVSSLGAAEDVSLDELMAWEQAPTNARRLDAAGLPVSITSSKVRGRNSFHKNLRRAIDEGGLEPERALAMLTTHPAELLGLADTLGTIEQGKTANLIVADGDIFDEDTKILDLWIDGRRHEINKPKPLDLSGTWLLETHDEREPATLTIKDNKKITFTADEESAEGRNLKIDGDRVSFVLDTEAMGETVTVIVSAIVKGDELTGWALLPNDQRIHFTGARQPADEESAEEAADDAETAAKDDEEPEFPIPEEYGYPFGPYAVTEIPEQRDILFTNATIWTSGPQGIIENGILRIRDGKIVGVWRAEDSRGPARVGPNTVEIDLGGAHITPGIIDAHSHTGLFQFGVNEGTQAVTSEVRIADAIDPGHINWYRQLAGGVTTVNSLHGSANPIGGQSQTHKIRWGARHPDDMLFEDATPGIKFALGENVKQANWGERFTSRYPQTRMGVETLIRDRFLAAQRYIEERDRGGPSFRRDLELEALAEILEGQRLIHCHSYRQDEILMLTRVARDFGFTIGSFQHVLEGYKVAEAIKEHALGASSFSDWWAYKYEVVDAIPHNGAIMHDVGVVVSFNSDSDELARRMNAEAGKAVKYGGVSPEDAIKFVTLNPAIQLGIADRVGSIEPGKDADLAIWSRDPLSATSRCLATWVDGREYFSDESDRAHRATIAAERDRLIQKLLSKGRKKKSDDKDAAPGDAEDAASEPQLVDSPDRDPPMTLAERLARQRVELMYLEALNYNIDPAHQTSGDCGCSIVHQVNTGGTR
ncbi:MAG: amidohydrolase family protein [Phycisphaerales bacterium JB037]